MRKKILVLILACTLLMLSACGSSKKATQPSSEPCKHTSKVVYEEQAATCTEDGYIQYQCAKCGELLDRETTAATDHKFVNGKCTKCGAKESYELPIIWQ